MKATNYGPFAICAPGQIQPIPATPRCAARQKWLDSARRVGRCTFVVPLRELTCSVPHTRHPMKLKRVHATEFQSIRDSNPFEIGDITSLVGKNEAGKSTVLQALYRLNPIIESDGKFDITDDYPRADVEDYRIDVETKKREPATVIRATFELDADEMAPIIAEVGKDTCPSSEIELSKGYAQGPGQFSFAFRASETKGLQHLVKNAGLHTDVESKLTTVSKAADARTVLVGEEQTESVTKLIATLQRIEQHGMSGFIYSQHIRALSRGGASCRRSVQGHWTLPFDSFGPTAIRRISATGATIDSSSTLIPRARLMRSAVGNVKLAEALFALTHTRRAVTDSRFAFDSKR